MTHEIAVTSSSAKAKRTSLVTRFWQWEASGILVALIALMVILSLATDNFLSTYNMSVVARQAAFVGIVALGQTLVLLVGGIDLSVGAAAGLSAIAGSLMLTMFGVNPYIVIPLTMLFGMCLGFINGFFVAGLRLNPFIVTLATWEIFAGMTMVITKGYPIRPLGETFGFFGKGELLSIPIPVLVFLVSGAFLIWVLTQTKFGRNIFAVGGNRDAAVLVGIRVKFVEFMVFGIAGMFAALAGILFASRMDAGQPSVGEGWLMGAITAAILGGTSLRGGQGSIVGTMLGAMLLTVLANGTVLLNVSGFWQRVIVGGVVLIAVLVDLFRRKN
ncbi:MULTISPECIES: ABC transporter permease [Agrobacterium]|jgi:ribose transport system permease protein|uniref:ABC transporter permease n=2 Tax=Agrobacterium TaxID=357 RepID=A0A4D7Z5Q7_AGRTU|nr:ABC transporter permease [Agrobacterium tumefaciens]KJF70842.1 ribose ABC transporter permease [Agrobacterium arsenijevicii]QCL98164.1 ABC transporter permease [Agrobacterium tumefaciens]